MYGKNQIEFLKEKKYLKDGETLEERIAAMVGVVRKHEKDYSEGLADRIKGYIDNQILSPSTPQWSNLGRRKKGNTQPLDRKSVV